MLLVVSLMHDCALRRHQAGDARGAADGQTVGASPTSVMTRTDDGQVRFAHDHDVRKVGDGAAGAARRARERARAARRDRSRCSQATAASRCAPRTCAGDELVGRLRLPGGLRVPHRRRPRRGPRTGRVAVAAVAPGGEADIYALKVDRTRPLRLQLRRDRQGRAYVGIACAGATDSLAGRRRRRRVSAAARSERRRRSACDLSSPGCGGVLRLAVPAGDVERRRAAEVELSLRRRGGHWSRPAGWRVRVGQHRDRVAGVDHAVVAPVGEEDQGRAIRSAARVRLNAPSSSSVPTARAVVRPGTSRVRDPA